MIRTPRRSPRPVLDTGRGEHHPRGRYLAGHTTRQRILHAALACLTSEGLSRTTLRAVAREAELSTAGLVHHFRSKDALLVGLVATEARALLSCAVASDFRLSRAAGELYLGILSDGGRRLPLSYSLTLRLRRRVRSGFPSVNAQVDLDRFDAALLAALAGDADPVAQPDPADEDEE